MQQLYVDLWIVVALPWYAAICEFALENGRSARAPVRRVVATRNAACRADRKAECREDDSEVISGSFNYPARRSQ